ncbi:MAG: hypothetical protein E6Q34_00020 [Burkholderiaceae bacterium]|nr:MAG: hypothetical protein E6Q34_00020 [Burkholderiaceae bacterium]
MKLKAQASLPVALLLCTAAPVSAQSFDQANTLTCKAAQIAPQLFSQEVLADCAFGRSAIVDPMSRPNTSPRPKQKSSSIVDPVTNTKPPKQGK